MATCILQIDKKALAYSINDEIVDFSRRDLSGVSLARNYKERRSTPATLSDAQLKQFVTQYAPEFHFHPDEPYLPTAVDTYLGKVKLYNAPGEQISAESSGVTDAEPETAVDTYLHVADESVKAGRIDQILVYVHASQLVSAPLVYDLQYWVFSAFPGSSIAALTIPSTLHFPLTSLLVTN